MGKRVFMKFRVVIIAPSGNPHVAAFSELAVALTSSIREVGHDCELKVNELSNDSINIILGFHLLNKGDIPQGIRYIIYQLEQLSESEGWFPTHSSMLPILKNAEAVWDFVNENVEFLRERGVNSSLLPVGFSKALSNIPQNSSPNIDVLFYGSRNERRGKILEELLAKGYRVKALFGIYGEERDRWIANSKLIINIHFYEASLFESVRLSYLVNNSIPVISESSSTYPWPKVPLIQADYDSLVERTEQALKDPNLSDYGQECHLNFRENYSLSKLIEPLIGAI